jgi:hypothetical protein
VQGDGGLTIDFPTSGNPSGLQGKRVGVDGNSNFDAVFPQAPTGSGTNASPYSLREDYKVYNGSPSDYVLVTQTITYVEQANGNPTDNVGVVIQVTNNTSSGSINYHAYWVNDLFDCGSQIRVGRPAERGGHAREHE